MNITNGFFIFTDLKGYAKLSEEEMIEFQTVTCKQLALTLKKFIKPECHIAFNTWGDAIYAVFEKGETAAEFAIAYRDFFRINKIGNKKLQPRIAGHFGQANLINDPLNNDKPNVYGKHVNTAARIEPVTRPGEIFVSKEFKDFYLQSPQTPSFKVEFDELGTLELAKGHGDNQVFRLKLSGEKSQILDKLIREDLTDYIPSIPKMSEAEKSTLKNVQCLTSVSMFDSVVKGLNFEDLGAWFLLELANEAKSFGSYEMCLDILQKADNVKMLINGESVHALRHLKHYKKIKANALTRLGRYKEAEDIMFGLWHSGHQDSDTLSMLAAQYKRRAIFGNNRDELIESIELDCIDHELLIRSCKLYVEAFRKDISAYYPAINAAYLYIISNRAETGRGRKLARYIEDSWEMPLNGDWWLAGTLAEAEMLCGESDEALKKFSFAIRNHNPTSFQLNSTLEQIKLYAKLTRSENEVENIINYLQKEYAKLQS